MGPPPQIPDVEAIRPIGSGAYGQVWLARNKISRILRAVKVIDKSRSTTVVRELSALQRYLEKMPEHHDNLMPILHVGETIEYLFYVMPAADSINGRPASLEADYEPASLAARLRSGALPPETCISLTRQLLAGAAALHSRGLVHRDVKPANCMFIEGKLKLADFGLVTVLDANVTAIGTRPYMPPDGIMNASADAYATGVVAYEMITGLPAIEFPRWPPTLPQRLSIPEIRMLNLFALKACHRDREARFQNANEAIGWLDESVASVSTPRKRSYKKASIISGIGGVFALSVAGLWIHLVPHSRSVNFITRPFEAEILLNGEVQRSGDGKPFRTPCTIPHVQEQTYHVVFRGSGLPDLDVGNVDFKQQDEVAGSWQ